MDNYETDDAKPLLTILTPGTTPEEVAAMVAWLCTDDCSFSTGAVFDLSGGRSSY